MGKVGERTIAPQAGSIFLPHLSRLTWIRGVWSGVLSPRIKRRKTSVLQKDSQGTESIALAHLVTPVTLRHGSPIHLSILPSFISRLPPSIHTLRITFVLPIRFWNLKYGPSKSSYFSLEGHKNEGEPDGAMILCIALEEKSIMVTFGDTKSLASVDLEGMSLKPFTCTFHLAENRSQLIFQPVAVYSKDQQRFIPLSEWEEPTNPSAVGTTIQLSLSPARTTSISLCTIAQLPPEILSLIFEVLSFDKYENPIKGLDKEYLVSFQRLSAVCQLWKAASVPYFNDYISMQERHARLKQYPHAGRLWKELLFERELDDDISAKTAKDVIAGSPNVTGVYMDALWNEEEAKIVLRAIEGLTRLDEVTFGEGGSRKWRKEEVETFMRRKSARIRTFRACDVEDFASSTSPGLQLSSNLKSLELAAYPPLPSLFLPHTLTRLILSNLCPLPPAVSGSCLSPLLKDITITLAPYSPDGKISILPKPLDFSHLKHLTRVYLDGGEETSRLVSPQFFHTLTNAKAIASIDARYCVMDWGFTGFVFSDFIRWFFGDRGMEEEGDTVNEAEKVKTTRGRQLTIELFFGSWRDEEICMARSVLREFGVIEGDYRIWIREGGEERH
ncbi:hypothetical protein BT69DRAFT_539079 [Atractiella rhizophila]|nr:hypothetical protein BT69DRAFT_539079 [Atractiella rhizophila]